MPAGDFPLLLRSFDFAQDDIVRELVILNGAKRSEVSLDMTAGDFPLF